MNSQASGKNINLTGKIRSPSLVRDKGYKSNSYVNNTLDHRLIDIFNLSSVRLYSGQYMWNEHAILWILWPCQWCHLTKQTGHKIHTLPTFIILIEADSNIYLFRSVWIRIGTDINFWISRINSIFLISKTPELAGHKKIQKHCSIAYIEIFSLKI
jgi:hypothetical protein